MIFHPVYFVRFLVVFHFKVTALTSRAGSEKKNLPQQTPFNFMYWSHFTKTFNEKRKKGFSLLLFNDLNYMDQGRNVDNRFLFACLADKSCHWLVVNMIMIESLISWWKDSRLERFITWAVKGSSKALHEDRMFTKLYNADFKFSFVRECHFLLTSDIILYPCCDFVLGISAFARLRVLIFGSCSYSFCFETDSRITSGNYTKGKRST